MRLSTTALAVALLVSSGTLAAAQSTGGSSSGAASSGSSGAGTSGSGTTGSTAGVNSPGTTTTCANADPLDITAQELGCPQTN